MIDLFKLADEIRSGLGFGDNAVKAAVRKGSSGGRGSNPTRRAPKPTAAQQAKANKRKYAEDKAKAAAAAAKKTKKAEPRAKFNRVGKAERKARVKSQKARQRAGEKKLTGSPKAKNGKGDT